MLILRGCSSKLQLLEWVSSEAVTSILHKLIEQRMEQHCRGEYERSFLLEFQKVKHLPVQTDDQWIVSQHQLLVTMCFSLHFVCLCVSSGWRWCWAGWAKCSQARSTQTVWHLLPVLPVLLVSKPASLPAPSWSSGDATCTSFSAGSMSTWGSKSSSASLEVQREREFLF